MANNTGLKSPLIYMGGKFHLADWILSLLPEEYDVYVEPFGGAGHVILKKEPKGLEVYNDTCEEMVNIFRTLQNKEKSEELLRLLYLTPHSRKFFYDLHDGVYTLDDSIPEDVRKAYYTLVMMKQSFAGNFQNRKPSWGFETKTNRAIQAISFSNLPEKLIPVIERLKTIQIEFLDFKDCIKKYDSPKTVFYCDPPYYYREFYYQNGFTKENHRELAEMLNNIEGKCAVSYYYFDGIEELYPQGKWRYERKQTYLRSQKVNNDEEKQKSTEILIMNYPPAVPDSEQMEI